MWSGTEAKLRRALLALGIVVVAIASSVPPAAAAVEGGVDGSFGVGGVSTVVVGSSAGAAAVVVEPDGRIVTAGQADVNGQQVIVSTRMLPSGQLDPSYGTGGIATVAVNGGAGVDSGAALALQPDGKIVIAGTGHNGTYGPLGFAAIRLTASGALDPSFGDDGIATVAIGAEAIANAVVIQPDGKIVLAGAALQGHNEFAATRLNANGTLDTSFGTNGIVTLTPTGAAWGMVLQPNGKLVLAGQADYLNPNLPNAQQFMAARLNTNGTLDNSFGRGGIVELPVGASALGFGIAIQNDSKLLITGPAFTTTNVNATARLNTNGTLDPSYATNGINTIPSDYGTNGIILDSSGRAVLPLVGPGAERINTNGTTDQTFGTNGTTMITSLKGGANGAAIQTDGKIILAGATTTNGQNAITVIRLDADAGTTTNSSTAGPSNSSPATKATSTTVKQKPPTVRASIAASCRAAKRQRTKSRRTRHTAHSRRGKRHHRRHRRPRTRKLLRNSVDGCSR